MDLNDKFNQISQIFNLILAPSCILLGFSSLYYLFRGRVTKLGKRKTIIFSILLIIIGSFKTFSLVSYQASHRTEKNHLTKVLEYISEGDLNKIKTANFSLEALNTYYSDLNLSSDMKMTPLGLAIISLRLDIIEFLLNRGVDPNFGTSNKGQLVSPVLLAIGKNSSQSLALLLKKGAKIDQKTSSGVMGPLFASIKMDSVELLTLLLDYNIKLDDELPKESGELANANALMFASYLGKLNFVKILVAHGMDPKKKNNMGLSAVDYATKSDAKDVKAYLSQ